MIALRNLRGQGKYTWREFDGEHNDTFLAPGYWEEVGKWLREEIEGGGEKGHETEQDKEEVLPESRKEEEKVDLGTDGESDWTHVEGVDSRG